jgi:D-glycero-D-manno-heptose 1,7-bisphosphate phosphatase
MRPAVFLDRDGTIIEAVHYLSDPAQVRLIDGAAEAIRALRGAGYACVVVTNQSAIGRGLLSVERLFEIHQEMRRQLAERGAELDGLYFCPVVPTSEDRVTIDHPDRKPGPGMVLKAAAELGLDLPRSWMIGDMMSDVLTGRNAGCRGSILVGAGHGGADDDSAAASLAEAARLILALDRAGSPTPSCSKICEPGP